MDAPVGLEHELGRAAHPSSVRLLQPSIDVGDVQELTAAAQLDRPRLHDVRVALASMAAVILGMNSFHGTMVSCRSTLFFFAHSWAKLARASSLDLRNW